jgi:hypothetical protein
MTSSFRKRAVGCVLALTTAASIVSTPAAAQWWGPGWGYGYGYNNGGAIAGAAIGGLALGALAGAAIANSQNQQYAAQPYYESPRRGRLCPAWQPIYDSWGNFVQYQKVRVAC